MTFNINTFFNQGPSTAIDIWSIGCIVTEMVLRRPMFPMISNSNHITIIKQVIGYGSRRKWTKFYPNVEAVDDLADFLDQMIAFEPGERLVNYFCLY